MKFQHVFWVAFDFQTSDLSFAAMMFSHFLLSQDISITCLRCWTWRRPMKLMTSLVASATPSTAMTWVALVASIVSLGGLPPNGEGSSKVDPFLYAQHNLKVGEAQATVDFRSDEVLKVQQWLIGIQQYFLQIYP